MPGPLELIIILSIVMLVFGASRLPKLARSMGESAKEFKKGVDTFDAREDRHDQEETKEQTEKREAAG
ncbi:MAG: twin-arginine translocase TatA/TatE family subunit [Acidimicrobiia bacterium]